MTRWKCRACSRQGLGGPDGWTRHWQADHVHNGRYGASLSFGFVPNFANGWMTSSPYDYRKAPRC